MNPQLLAAVLADPDDDSARLVLADWLEENGEPERAEFIRVQLELEIFARCIRNCSPWPGIVHKPDVAPTLERFMALRHRERELLKAHHLEWGPHFNKVHGLGNLYAFDDFRRGFLERITCAAADWITHADAITTTQPIRKVTLTTWPDVEELTTGSIFASPPSSSYRQPMRLVGRGVKWWSWSELAHVEKSLHQALLRVHWPRITFTLPPRGLAP